MMSTLAASAAGAAPPSVQGPGAGPAQGQAHPRERAARAFQEALLAFQNLDFELARQRYEEAYRLAPHPNTLYNLALACERLLDYDAAIAAFKRFLDEPLLADAEAARLQQTRRLLAERSLRRLISLPARVSLSAVPDPVTASVTPLSPGPAQAGDTADGSDEKRCETPCILTMPAGRYRLTMQREGYFPEQIDFEARVGQALLISRQLRPRPRRVLIESSPRARL
jgi:tetratricopeptide (TPR) repeat protein